MYSYILYSAKFQQGKALGISRFKVLVKKMLVNLHFQHLASLVNQLGKILANDVHFAKSAKYKPDHPLSCMVNPVTHVIWRKVTHLTQIC